MEEHPYDREAVLKYSAQVRNSGVSPSNSNIILILFGFNELIEN